MAPNLPSGAVPRFWPLLYDDDYLSNHGRFEDGAAPIPHSPRALLCAIYPDPAADFWRSGDLFLAARSRHADHFYMCVSDETHEADGFEKDDGEHRRREVGDRRRGENG